MERISRLEGKERDLILKSFCNDLTATQAAEMSEVNRNTANKWFRIFRELISEYQQKAPRFKGIIELDQAFFGRRRRQVRKRKPSKRGFNYGLDGVGYSPTYKRDGRPEDLMQVAGFMLRKPKGKTFIYTHVIKNSKKDTVMPLVHLIIEGGASIYTDSHSSFSDLELSGYKHKKVNHSKKINSLGKGVHTNNLESFWGFSKTRLEKFRGISRETLPLHVKECEFRWNNKGNIPVLMKKLIAS
jgi:transposase